MRSTPPPDPPAADTDRQGRARKVEEIRERVASGSYEIDIDALAARMVEVLGPDGERGDDGDC